jgi:starch phosphorylase
MATSAPEYHSIITGNDPDTLASEIRRAIVSELGSDPWHAGRYQVYRGLSRAVRDRLIDNWIRTQRSYYDHRSKRVYYLSLEFLPGRFLRNALVNLGLVEAAGEAVRRLGFNLDEVENEEWDPGLGNGGLGRLASCFLASMASLKIPGYGYGIRYDYGIFYQLIEHGWQVERPDHWLRLGDPWSIARHQFLYQVKFFGRVVRRTHADGRVTCHWVDTDNVMALAHDILVPGFGNGNAINMRLWSARASREVDLASYQQGDYIGAIEGKVTTENISRVLYPSEQVRQGKELRLRQEYFFVAATFQDILRRFAKCGLPLGRLPERVAVQLNDTHPAIAVAELMRLLVDGERMPWEAAWEVCQRTFGYTNHTLLPEALESWPVDLLGRVLPRHLEIIFELNRRFLDEVALRYPGDGGRLARLSLIAEEPERRVRMANLAVIGSHAVNGVSALHSRMLKEHTLRDFAEIFPDRFTNVTNGIDHRRFLLQANPGLAGLITEAIGDGWVTDLEGLAALEPLAEDAGFCDRWRALRRRARAGLATWVADRTGELADPEAMVDIQVKRIHEYKRQLLNVMHVLTLADRLRSGGGDVVGPRTVLIGGKAAPGYAAAKLLIKLVNAVAEWVRADPRTGDVLTVAFVPNYRVTTAERLVSACDLSEQISTAGMEASGTGNMKFALNGALLIGTLDGANIEIRDRVGDAAVFTFGLSADQVLARRSARPDPREIVAGDAELGRVIGLLEGDELCPEQPGLFRSVVDGLYGSGDYFMVLADYRDYVDTQRRAAALFENDPEDWTRRSIRSVARMGAFSSDRAIREYVERIWRL